jgi:NodT family efflux transporter outer membrane factor (OMF) lipoprotein
MRMPALWFAALALAGCAVGPDFKAPPAPGDASYGSAPVSGATADTSADGGAAQHFVTGLDIPGDWWTLFRSDALDELVRQALRDNPDLAAARAALREANELYAAQRASLFPSVQGSFSAQRAKNATETIANPTVLQQQNPYYNLFTAQLSVSYEPDVFGGQRRALELSGAQAQAQRFELAATYITLSSNVVVTAIQEAALREQVSATARLLAVQRELTAKLVRQTELGSSSRLDLLTQQASEAQTAALLPPLRKQLTQTRDALTALLGRLPAAEPAQRIELAQLALPSELPVTLPGHLIEQRPDVQQAQADLHAASAQLGVATAQLLPQFTLSAQTGSTALDLAALFTSNTGFWGAGAALTQTLFDAGALRHRRRAAAAALDAAGARYRGAVILACQNVADTLHALQQDAEALSADASAEQAARYAFEIARQQQALGSISTVALLTAEQAYQQASLAVIQARANRYADTAALYQALGGGWWNRAEGELK